MAKRVLTGHVGGTLPRESGFTMVEAMIAMGVTMTVLLALLGMFNSAFRVYDKGEDLTIATNLAMRKIGDFKHLQITDILSGTDCVDRVGGPICCDCNPVDGVDDAGAFRRVCVSNTAPGIPFSGAPALAATVACDPPPDDDILGDNLLQRICFDRDGMILPCDADADGLLDPPVFLHSWALSYVDLEPDGTPDLVGNLVKVDLRVMWSRKFRGHHVSMTSLTTGRPQQ